MFNSLFKSLRSNVIFFTVGTLILSFLFLGIKGIWANEEYEKRVKDAEKNLSKLEAELKTAKDQSHRDRLHLAIAELYTKFPYNFPKAWDHLMKVSDETPETERLCNLLWECAFLLEAPALYSGNYKDLDWGPIKLAFDRINHLAPQSDSARRALYQLGRYYKAKRDWPGWRANRQEFIRRFGVQKPLYAAVAAREIGDSFLFEGNIKAAREQYEQFTQQSPDKNNKTMHAEAYIRLIQTSWLKSSEQPKKKLKEWRQGLAIALGFDEYNNYDLKPLYSWLDQILEENRIKAAALSPEAWSEVNDLDPMNVSARFYKGVFDHIALKKDWLGRLKSKSAIEKKVTRVKADLRTIATGLECYIIDWCGGYPPLKAGGLGVLMASPSFGDPEAPDTKTKASMPGKYIRAIQYMTLPPLDPFGEKRTDQYLYWTGDKAPQSWGWILVSRGPDGTIEIEPEKDYDANIPQPSPGLLLKSYDPTNGITSRGDIFRVKQ